MIYCGNLMHVDGLLCTKVIIYHLLWDLMHVDGLLCTKVTIYHLLWDLMHVDGLLCTKVIIYHLLWESHACRWPALYQGNLPQYKMFGDITNFIIKI